MSIERYGSYELIKRLATGGMAQIYLASEQAEDGSEKMVVVKRILAHLAENLDFVRMFLDEARIAARLNHPNIVQIFNLGAQDDSYFLAMEYIHGEDVRRISKAASQKGRALPHALVARIIAEACAGLDYAHKKADAQGKPLNIVHRDVSPQNILVGFDGKVKVVDFGIAKAADQATVTRSGVLKGKYSYMSPEQAGGKKLDRRSDIFALGVVLWELLTNERLFKRANEIQTLTAVGECKVTPPSVLAKTIPPELDAIVLKALAKSPEGRFQEAAELRSALEKWCAQQPKSSTAELAAFMRELFAERLAEEAKEGRLLVGEQDDAPKVPRRSKAPPPDELPRTMLEIQGVPPTMTVIRPSRSDGSGRSARRSDPSGGARRSQGSARRSNSAAPVAVPPASVASPVIDPPSDLAATAMAARTISEPPGYREQPSVSDQATKSLGPDRKARIALYGLAAAVVLGLSGGLLYMASNQRSPAIAAVPVSKLPARVRIVSDPPGASVTFNGKRVPERTPCVLPPVPKGTYPLVVTKAGYNEYRTSITLPASGEASFPVMRLQAVADGRVSVVLQSDPAGATLSVDGTLVGKTPQTIQAKLGDELVIKLEHPGYYSLRRQLKATPQLAPVQKLKLERQNDDGPLGRSKLN